MYCHGMAEMAASHPNDLISVALSRTSQKLESIYKPFAAQLNSVDYKVIQYYIDNK